MKSSFLYYEILRALKQRLKPGLFNKQQYLIIPFNFIDLRDSIWTIQKKTNANAI